MATASECYSALCNIRSVIVEQLSLLGYPVEAHDCLHMCLTDLINIYASYTGRTYNVDDLDAFILTTAPSAEWLNKVIECNKCFATCIELSNGEYAWTKLDEESILIEHTITADGTYAASDFSATGFSKITVDTSARRNLQNKTVTPTDTVQPVIADAGFNGLATVTVKAVPTENANIVPIEEQQVVEPSEGHFFKKVTVDAVINQHKSVVPSVEEQCIKADVGFNGLAEVRVAGSPNLLPEHILKDLSIFGVIGTLTPAGMSGKPIELTTVEEMEHRRATATSDTVGMLYKYTGDTNGEYIKDMLYTVASIDNVCVMQKLSAALLRLAAPTIRLNGDVLSWDAIPYAKTYAVCTTDYTLGYTSSTSFSIPSNIYESSLSLYVIAMSTGYDNSFASNAVTWFSSTVSIIKHSNIPFSVPCMYSLATSFNNNAVFYCRDNNNDANKLLSFDSSLSYTEFILDDSSSFYHCIDASNEHLFLTDNDNIYAYKANMVMTMVPLLHTKHAQAASNLNNYSINVGINMGYYYNSIYAEVIDNNLVSFELECPDIIPDYAVVACSTPNYAIFTDCNSFGIVYDKDLVAIPLLELPKDSYSKAVTNLHEYAIYAGGEVSPYGLEGTLPVYSSSTFAYDTDLTIIVLTDLPHEARDITSASFAGFAVFAGGQTVSTGAYSSSATVYAYDANLSLQGTSSALCTGKVGVAAATVDKYLIVGAHSDFMYADVFTTHKV